MATPERTQKELSARYQGDVDYYGRPHPWRVARFCATFVAIVGGIAGIFVYDKLIAQKRVSENFFSPGQISRSHAMLQESCAGCHGKSAPAGHELTPAKFQSDLKDRFHRGIDFSLIDRNCQDCHEGKPPFKPKPGFVVPRDYKLHEPNVVNDRTCSICHQEHLGPGRMEKVADWHCASCHNNPGVMEASAQKGKTIAPKEFHLRPGPAHQIVFPVKRPERGYTEVFPAFDSGDPKRDHPEFQLIREKARDLDNDVLRFSHATHFKKEKVQKDGRMIESCNYCHKADPEGRFYQRISYKANCQECHSLQFDKNNPQLHIPHGDANLVRNYLRTLPAQYEDFARLNLVRKDGSATLVPRTKNMIITDRERVREGDAKIFVAQQIKLLREQFGGDGLALEHDVFFVTSPYKAQRENPDDRTRANFVGCAYCHQVKEVPNAAPVVNKPILVDRWMPQARFNHAKHTKVDCNECHRAQQSIKASDVLMPAKADCAKCHSPRVKNSVVSECITCHTYHAPSQVVATDVHADARESSFREMLVGK
jgi:hypothetical protein